ncbi:MAG: membrane protein insertase YidC [Paludibacteraceae bacterium]|nr:membrane protein insertase YidC [Paludibacteraceae bacterium]
MDKNTGIGLVLIAAILIGFSLFNRPSEEELERRQHVQDSIALVNRQKAEAMAQQSAVNDSLRALAAQDTLSVEEIEAQHRAQFGALAPAAQGSDEQQVIETKLFRLTFSPKGGMLSKAELKDYKTYGDSINPLVLFAEKDKKQTFTLVTAENRILSTENLYFKPQPVTTDTAGNQVVTFRLETVYPESYLDFVYTIPDSNYMIGFDIRAHKMQNVLAGNVNGLEMLWEQQIPQQERGRRFEERYAQLQYMFTNRDIEKLSESKADREKVTGKLRWIAYKDQFFSTVLIARGEGFETTVLESEPLGKYTGYIKHYTTNTTLAFDPTGNAPTAFSWYLGPNHYHTLNAYDEGVQKYDRLRLRELVPLGWEIVAWINRILVIPMFDLFKRWGLNMGIIILLMTIVIKLIIFPFTFKSYKSAAKMRALKPQVDEINEKYPPEKMAERQQATMALYSQAGASPMAGCLPMLFQFPVVMAMFWFFPTAIELRGESFLWADDLSTYDAILSWDKYIPVISWAFNNHLSLFCILFTVTNFVYTYITMQTQATANDPSAKMMRWMMYLMPLMFFFMFNDYAAGLSYYYFLSLLISILQTMIFRWTLNDKRMLEEMERAKAKKKSAPKKKSGFMARLEAMQKEQQARMREQIKEQAKKQYR